jgi:hypothetical protein
MSILRSATAAAVAFVSLQIAAADAQQVAAPTNAVGTGVPAAAQTGQASPPRCDVNCVRENAAAAATACAPRIEAQAPTDFDWITRPNPGIFQQADPSSPSDSIVRYRGDSLRFMVADKSWARVRYECGYDVSTHSVSYAQVRSGRLDQPLTPVEPQGQTSAAARPVATPVIASSAAAPPATTRPPRPRVGEPSAVTIQQQVANPKPH